MAIITNRNFANKLWNVARYIEGMVGDQPDRAGAKPESIADHWILSKLQQSQQKIQADLDNFRFGEAYDRLYHFVWDDLADWYVEASKAAPNKPLLAYLLEQVMLLAHPFAPFLTEAIWQTLAWEHDSILASRESEKVIGNDAKRAAAFAEIQAIVSEVRFITNALKVAAPTLYHTGNAFLTDNAATIKHLARLQDVAAVANGTGLFLTDTKRQAWLDIDKAAAKAYAQELDSKRAEQAAAIKRLETRLNNKNYVQNAPKDVVAETKQQLAAAKQQLATLDAERQRFGD